MAMFSGRSRHTEPVRRSTRDKIDEEREIRREPYEGSSHHRHRSNHHSSRRKTSIDEEVIIVRRSSGDGRDVSRKPTAPRSSADPKSSTRPKSKSHQDEEPTKLKPERRKSTHKRERDSTPLRRIKHTVSRDVPSSSAGKPSATR